MQTKITKRIIALGLLSLLVSITGFGQEKGKPAQKELTEKQLRQFERNGKKPPSGPGFFIAPIEASKGLFSLLLSDGNGNSVTGSFTRQQVDVFEAVLEAANAFALTDEKVGSDAPIITRLMEQHEWSLFVDVSKKGTQSKVYVSLITLTGRMTVEAGEITRGSKRDPSALFVKMLSQVQEAKAIVPFPQ
jgi:hypothetical protein